METIRWPELREQLRNINYQRVEDEYLFQPGSVMDKALNNLTELFSHLKFTLNELGITHYSNKCN